MDNYINRIEDFEEAQSAINDYGNRLRLQDKENRKNRFSFIVGFAVIVFAVIGLCGCIFQTAVHFSEKSAEKKNENLASYHSFMLAVAAVDPEPFDDITAAGMDELIEIAVWSIIGSDLDPNRYDYSSGELAIPAAEIEAAFVRYFGNEVAISHRSVTGYGYEFSYDADANVYYIPLTAVEPLYTPVVTEGNAKGDTVVLTLGLVNTGAWQQDAATGYMKMPDPDKYIRVTLRKTAGTAVISSIRTSSRPETAIVDIVTEAPSSQKEAENTTG